MSSAIGLYGLGETNEAGEQLEEFYLEHELALANTMFKQHQTTSKAAVYLDLS